MTFEQRERAIGMLTAGMSARDVAWHFQCHESTISRLLNKFQQTRNVVHRPRSGRPHKTTPLEDRCLMTSSRRSGFLFSRKLGRLLRNATGTSVCDRTVRNRLLRLIESMPSLSSHSADVMELSSLLVNCICNNITLGFSNMIMPIHTLRGHTQNILHIHNVNVLQWPARSPDPSPIDHLWDHLGRQVREHHDVNNIRDLELALQAEWVKIPLQVIRKLICSTRRCCLAVLAANGGHISFWAMSEFLRLTTYFISRTPETKRSKIME